MTGKLLQKTKELTAKRKNMKLLNTVDQTELAKLSKLIDRSKTNNTRKYNMALIKQMLK